MENKKKAKYIESLVSNSKAIITNQIGLPLGVQKMNKILIWINQIEPLEGIEISIFEKCYKELSQYQISAERLHSSIDFILKQEEHIDGILSKYKNEIIRKSFEIIKTFEICKE